MGISGPKSRPDSVKGGFVDQNGLRGFVEGGVGIGTKTSPAQALEKIRGELRHVRREVQAEYGRILDFLVTILWISNLRIMFHLGSNPPHRNVRKRSGNVWNDDEKQTTGKKKEKRKKKKTEE
ncbi:hypothetical protein KY285_004648 [Solanum tuberosum]|nr:hypothetical protein KY285_004648 [Solanum tuberosum]